MTDRPEHASAAEDAPPGTTWASLRQMLAALDATQAYVVLRNFEGLPESLTLSGHDDLDLLVERAEDAARALRAQRVFPQPYRRHYEVRIGDRALRVDLRSVGDRYFDATWQREVLQRRTTTPAGVKVPSPPDAFWTLLYHALVHKPALSREYAARLTAMARQLGVRHPEPLARTAAWRLLSEEMARRAWRLVEPEDLGVWFHRDAWPATPPGVRRRARQTLLAVRWRLGRLPRGSRR